MPAKSKKRSAKRTRKVTPAPEPKRIVYLFGAGATQAEVNYLGARKINVLMRDSDELGEGIATGVLGRSGADALFFTTDKGIDIEKLISLLATSGVDRHLELAETFRRHYFEETCTRIADSKIIDSLELTTALLEMHANRAFQARVETLIGILTTNHDGLLQTAFEKTFGAVNLGLPFVSTVLHSSNGKAIPPLLQLHGSFTWRFALPLEVTTLTKVSVHFTDACWIPPTVAKESKNYPFNKLTALAYEILSKNCDVLRVVGSSLTQNDWNILSLIFNAQRHRERFGQSPFNIQLITSQKGGKTIERDSAFLKNLMPMGSLTEGQFDEYRNHDEVDPLPNSDMANGFFFWLREKINYHQGNREFGTSALTGAMARVAGVSL
jgi:hypothetical protein